MFLFIVIFTLEFYFIMVYFFFSKFRSSFVNSNFVGPILMYPLDRLYEIKIMDLKKKKKKFILRKNNHSNHKIHYNNFIITVKLSNILQKSQNVLKNILL